MEAETGVRHPEAKAGQGLLAVTRNQKGKEGISSRIFEGSAALLDFALPVLRTPSKFTGLPHFTALSFIGPSRYCVFTK